MSRIVLVIAVLIWIAPAALRAADTTAADPSNGSYTATPSVGTTPSNPTASKPHHRHKKKTTAPASSAKAVVPPSTNTPPTATAAGNPGDSGLSNMGAGMGSDNPGRPNMGSSDHTPGTTGTSGQ